MNDAEQARLVDLGAQYLYPNYRQPPLVMVRGRGAELWDAAGKRYLDLYAGIAVNTLGHAHPRLTAAIAEQAGRLMHISNYFYNQPNVELAAKLCGLSRMDRALFCNSGTEAIEATLKLARHHFYLQGQTERFNVIAFHRSFHGRTLGALTATGQAAYRDGFGPLSGVIHVDYGDLGAVERALDDSVCAVLVEPIQGEGGVIPAPSGFLEGLRQLTNAHGALLLADEIQTGIGRTGTFLAFHHSHVEPDAVAVAKGLGGGFPIGAMLCKQHLMGALPPGSHGSTFGGNPLASAAALAVLTVLEEENLMAATASKGEFLAERLSQLAAAHPDKIEATRGRGLLQAIVLREGVDVRAVHGKLRDAGVLVTIAGGCALRISPALVVTQAELELGLTAIDSVLKETSLGTPS